MVTKLNMYIHDTMILKGPDAHPQLHVEATESTSASYEPHTQPVHLPVWQNLHRPLPGGVSSPQQDDPGMMPPSEQSFHPVEKWRLGRGSQVVH